MTKLTPSQLLGIPGVVEEIQRHLWIESEKAGYDRGFEWAAEDWINRFSLDWLQHHRPDLLKKGKSAKSPEATPAKKKRSAKSYLY